MKLEELREAMEATPRHSTEWYEAASKFWSEWADRADERGLVEGDSILEMFMNAVAGKTAGHAARKDAADFAEVAKRRRAAEANGWPGWPAPLEKWLQRGEDQIEREVRG